MPRTPGSRTPQPRRRLRRHRRTAAWGAALAVSLAGGAFLVPHGAEAAPFTGGNVVVYRVGTGAALTNAAAPVFLDEYSPSGTQVQSIALPTSGADGNHALTASGQSRSEGLISRSADGRSIALTGYDAAPGTDGGPNTATADPADRLSLTATSPTTVGRTVGLVDANGTVDTSTLLSTATDPQILRSAASSDGDRLWAAGGNGGILTQTLGATAHTAVGATTVNRTGLSIQGGKLLAGGIGSHRVAKVGDGLPTAAGTTYTDVAGLPDNLLTYGFGFLDATDKNWSGTGFDTLYLANASERGGTVDKYTYSGSAWSPAGSYDVPGVFGLVADKSGSKATLAVTTPTQLIALEDANAAASSFAPTSTTLATAASGTEFRGVALAPTATAGPSLFVRKPVTASNVGLASAGVPVSALADGPDPITSVTAKLGSGAAKALTKGAGKVWSGTLPFGTSAAGASSLTVVATDSTGKTRTVTRSITISPVVAPKGTAGPGKRSWTVAPVVRTGTWGTFSTTDSPTRQGLTSAAKGRKATVKVFGRSVVLTFRRTVSSGYANVTVDGRTTKVSLYAAKTGVLSKTWTFGTGAVTSHTVVVTVTGTKPAGSKGLTVGLSSFRVAS